MSGFKALNVDSESEEEEIDDTKEMQTEDAFKLYQNALRLQSQGADSFQEAEAAYQELFKSEVFKYPEAISEFANDQIDEDVPPPTAQAYTEPVATLPSTATDASATSIPQIVYLSHKNRGDFALDQARANHPSEPLDRRSEHQHYSSACKNGLLDFAEALERDDTDIDLWKKAARVAEVLKSERIARFCYESALAGENDGTEQTIDLSGLDEAFAAGELAKIQRLLQDDLSIAQSVDIKPRQALLALLAKSSDPYSFLPQRTETLEYIDDKMRPNNFEIGVIKFTSKNMLQLGGEILELITKYQDGDQSVSAQSLVTIDVLDLPQSPSDMGDEVFVDADEMMDIQAYKQEESPALMEEAVANETTIGPTNALVEDTPTAEQDFPTGHQRTQSLDLPTRKRSSAAAGNEEPEARVRSKRLRARESLADVAAPEEEVVQENPAHQSWHWKVLQTADNDVNNMLNALFTKLQIQPSSTSAEIRALSWPATAPTIQPARELLHYDLGTALHAWTDDHSQAVINGHGYQDFVEKSAGMALFLQHSKPSAEFDAIPTKRGDVENMATFTGRLSSSTHTLYESVYLWFETILAPASEGLSSYLRDSWSDGYKQTLVQLLIRTDEYMLDTMQQRFQSLATRLTTVEPETSEHIIAVTAGVEMAQAIFELHVDILSRITNPNSQVLRDERIKQADRLERWAAVADDYMRLYAENVPRRDISKTLTMRFLWASVIYAGKADDVDQNHIIQCLKDLRLLVDQPDFEPVTLPNNAAMPHISSVAADQEISRLSTLDFFTNIFDNDAAEPVAIIEKLEPILEYDLALASGRITPAENFDTNTTNLVKFLNSGDASLKLFLWRRLQNAYVNINYNPRVVSCMLSSIEVISNELKSARHLQLDDTTRQLAMLRWLKDIDELLIRILSKALTDDTALEFLDSERILTTISTVSFILQLVLTYTFNEDSIRFGYTTGPQFPTAASTRLWEKSRDRFREMLSHLWVIQYILVKDATAQYSELFPERANDLADYLCTVHHALGQRRYCRTSNKQFVRLVKSELNSLETTNDYFADMAQVCFDLYDLKFRTAVGDFDHGCPSESSLDRKTALSLIPTVMAFANRMDMKDLVRSDLKTTIDDVQAALGTTKSSKNLLHNKKLLVNYLRSPVIPEELYRAIKGVGDLPPRPVNDESSAKAKHGWFFLLGYMTLAKYRSVKRVSPTSTDDLEIASQFLQQDLQHDMEKWETWYRLAQVFEAKIEDDLIWNSTKLNDARDDIALLERNAIHCFTMAVAVAMRSAEDNEHTAQKIGDLHREFAIRLYASSRAPLNMEAFKTDKQIRHLSDVHTSVMSKQPFHQAMTEYQLWNFAQHLLKKKFTDRPKPWISHYTLTKCLWKMYTQPSAGSNRIKITPEQILSPIVEAIEGLPRKDGRSDPVLEPHVKLVSVVHKLVLRKDLTPQQGRDWLQASHYSKNVPLVMEGDEPDWERYILDMLKKLQQADKANWHHRIVARRAHVIYDGDADVPGALGAKHELMQQVFTKTMTYNVWKPENERPGRHYVYTSRYVLFFAHLLDQLNDRGNLDQLVRRVRRKQTDFIDHSKIWEIITSTYVRLLRRVGKIKEDKERELFDSIRYDDFVRDSDKLERWAMEPDQTSAVLEIMRDAIELKKLNNSLAKGGYIDDLIGDAYASLYEEYVSQLPKEEQPAPKPDPFPEGTFINMTSDSRPHSSAGLDGAPVVETINTDPTGLGIHTPNHHFVAPPLPPSSTNPSAPTERAKPGRAKTITRREVQRKADAMLVRPQPIKTPVLSKRPVIEIPSTSSPAPNGQTDGLHDARLDRLRDGSGDDSRASSRRGSLDPGADADNEGENENESVGSDGERERDGQSAMRRHKGLLFPGLQKVVEMEENQSDADDDDEEEDAEEGEGDGDEGDGTDGHDEDGDEGEGDERDEEHGDGDGDGMDVDEEPEIPGSQNA